MRAFNEFRRKQGIGATRIRLGFTQDQFAEKLGISRSMMCMAESGQRSLPMSALAKLTALEIAMAAAQNQNTGAGMHPAETGDHWLNDHSVAIAEYKEMTCRQEAERRQCDLDIMIARYSKVRESLAQIERLLNCGETGFHPGYLEIHRQSLILRLNKCGIPAQNALRTRIAMLYAKAGFHAMDARLFKKNNPGNNSNL